MTTEPTTPPDPAPQGYARSLVDHDTNHREPVADCEWCPYPEPAPANPAATGSTPGAPVVLGRALLDGRGHAWSYGGDDGLWPVRRAELLQSDAVREVLLVSPAAGRVLEAAQALVEAWGTERWSPAAAAGGFGRLETELAASLGVSIVKGVSVDAMAGDRPPAVERDAAGPVLTAAQRMAGALRLVDALGLPVSGPGRALLDAVDGDRPDEPAPARFLDEAAHSVWLHGDWQWLTSQMTTEQREVFGDAVDRTLACHNADDPELGLSPVDRWWHDDATVAADLTSPTDVAAVAMDDRERAGWAALGEPDPEPDSGPGWDRGDIAAIIEGWNLRGVSDGSQETLTALLADRDRLARNMTEEKLAARQSQRAADLLADERDTARREMQGVRDELTRTAAENDDLRGTLAMRDAQLREVTAERDNLEVQVRAYLRLLDAIGDAVPGAGRPIDAVNRLRDEANAHEGELGDMRAQLAAAEVEVDRLRAELEQARREHPAVDLDRWTRDAAADELSRTAAHLAAPAVWADTFGRWSAGQAEAAGDQKQLMVDKVLARANKVRSGRRTIRSQPETATSGEAGQ